MRRLLLLFSTIGLILTNCKAKNNPENQNKLAPGLNNKDNVEKFWIWFSENEKQLRQFEENPDKYLNQILVQAKQVASGLAIELEPPVNGIINMTISANGDKNLFNIVQDIIARAPKIEGWNFLAFRQRLNSEKLKSLKLKIEEVELDPARMKFFPVISGKTLDLIIYVKGVTESNYNQIAYGGLMMLDNILGEYDCVTKVRSYDFHDMPLSKKELDELHPLLELPAYVDKFNSEKKN